MKRSHDHSPNQDSKRPRSLTQPRGSQQNDFSEDVFTPNLNVFNSPPVVGLPSVWELPAIPVRLLGPSLQCMPSSHFAPGPSLPTIARSLIGPGPSARQVPYQDPSPVAKGPESFYQLQNVMVKFLHDVPETFLNDTLSKDIWSHFIQGQQPGPMFKQKIDLWCELDQVLSSSFRCFIHAFGSTLNGFGSEESDLDLCLFYDSESDNAKQKGRKDVEMLARVRKILRAKCQKYISGNMELIPAKVPILKFYDSFGHLEVDLSCNNPLSVKNTHLLFCYSQMDWRVRPLVLAIKAWAKRNDINDAKNSTLSSYTLTLMILHFLQSGVNPPVIPSLQKLHPNIFGISVPPSELSFIHNIPSEKSKNNLTLGQLLKSFFVYYNDRFDFTRDAGSIREGKVIPINDCQTYARVNKLIPGQWDAYICMEEPFERTNAGRAVVRRERFDIILAELKTAHKKIKKDGKNLASIFKRDT